MTPLINPTDRIFVAGHPCRGRGMARFFTATREELDLLNPEAVQC